MSSNSNISNGIGLSTVLFLIFLVLKLTGNINWSWWWITALLWIPIAIIFVVFFIAFLIYLYKGR